MSVENGCHYCRSCDVCDNKDCLVNKQKIEIERLTEYCEMFERGEIGSPMTTDKMLALEKEKIELQKKVDELKEEIHKIESSENETYMIGFEDGEKQAVKNTATEIFAELFYMASIHHSDVANILSWAKEKAKSKGLEVE